MKPLYGAIKLQSPAPKHQEDQLFKRAFILSTILHLGLLIAFTVRTFFYEPQDLNLDRAIRVDLVDLPDKMATLPPMDAAPTTESTQAPPVTPEAKPIEAKPTEKTTSKPLPEPKSQKINLSDSAKQKHSSKHDQEAAIKRLEAMQKLEAMMQDKSASNARKAALIKGNVISNGSSLRGTARLDNDNYKSLLDEHVHRHWNLPQWLASANLKARIIVYIDDRGNVVRKQISRSSGNQVFDERVTLAIENASPFPAPPRQLANLLAVEGIEFGFPE
jgi:protein TonB